MDDASFHNRTHRKSVPKPTPVSNCNHLILTMKIGPDILQLSDTWKGERNFTNNIYVEFFILR